MRRAARRYGGFALKAAGGGSFFSDVGLLMHFEGSGSSFVDSSSYGHTLTPTGNIPTQTTANPKFGSKSGYWADAFRAISCADTPSINVATGDFTLEGWFYVASATLGTNVVLFSKAVGTSYSQYILWNQSGPLHFICYRGDAGVSGATAVNLDCGTTPTDQFFHFAAVRHGDDFLCFINGTLVASTTYTGDLYDNGSTLYIGGFANGLNYGPNGGYIDEFRITKRALYTADFTPPASAFPDA